MPRSSVPALLRELLHPASWAPDLESGATFIESGAKNHFHSHPRLCASSDLCSKSHLEIFEDAWRECERWYWKPGRALPTPLLLDDVNELRHRGFYLPRRPAHAILMAARGFMNEELMRSEDMSFVHSLAERPWKMLVVGASDQIRGQLVGPGIREFRLEMHRNSKCSLWIVFSAWCSYYNFTLLLS